GRCRGGRTAAIWFQFGPSYTSTAELRVSANSRADIVVDPGHVQFGTVSHDETRPSKTINVQYAGKLAWQVTKVTTPAGAPLEATIRETYRRPGEVGYQLTVTLEPNAAPGHFQETVILETNDPGAARLPVPVDGTVQWGPRVLSLGSVKVGEKLTTKRLLLGAYKSFLVLGI